MSITRKKIDSLGRETDKAEFNYKSASRTDEERHIVTSIKKTEEVHYICQFCFLKTKQVYKCLFCNLELCEEHILNHSCIKHKPDKVKFVSTNDSKQTETGKTIKSKKPWWKFW